MTRRCAFAIALTTATLGVPAQPTLERRTEAPNADLDFARRLSSAFGHAADRIEPAVVHVTSVERVQQVRRRFGRIVERGDVVEQQTGLGSGVIIDELGHVVTNAHVITADQRTGNIADRLIVRLADGREYDAELIGADTESDLAVLRIEADGLVAASWGDSEAASVGQWVIAVGSPFGFDQSVTAGIISSKGRPSLESGRGNNQRPMFQEFLQTDAAINPGNSGGPLVDLEGRVLGINTAIASRSGGNNGLGFAIPADIVRSVASRIIENGRVDRGYIGITWNLSEPTIEPELARRLGIVGGVRVTTVMDDGPADDAGLEPGDIITRFGARTTENATRLRNAIAIAVPGAVVEVEYYRGDRRRTTTLRVIDRETGLAIASQAREVPALGVYAGNRVLEQTDRRGRVVGSFTGAEIIRLDPDGPAAGVGLEPGDIIVDVDGRTIDGAEDLADRVDDRDVARGVTIGIYRPSPTGRGGLRGTVEIRTGD